MDTNGSEEVENNYVEIVIDDEKEEKELEEFINDCNELNSLLNEESDVVNIYIKFI